MAEYYFVSYMRRNGKDIDEIFDNFTDANNRKNALINVFGYSSIEIKLSCKFMKVQ